jgi:ubiquinone/menaquinone biosynthesis C-methylase UbiE
MSDIAYLDHAAASGPGRAYKQDLLSLLELRPGLSLLDAGCGPGTDLPEMASQVGPDGRITGLDADPVMTAEARRRCANLPQVDLFEGDLHALPFGRGIFDRARTDRVLQHVADPAQALAELRRVLKPGGLLVMAEPDWDTLAIDSADLELSRAYTRYLTSSVVRNAVIGRQLPRLAAQAGFQIRACSPRVALFTDFTAAEQILRVRHVSARAINDEAIGAEAAQRWLQGLADGPYLASFTFYLVAVQAPLG